MPADRCGVWWVKVFHLYNGWFRKVAFTGNFVKVSVRQTRLRRKLRKKARVVGIIIRVVKETYKNDSSFIKLKKNNLVLLKKRMTPRGKELVGPISWRIRRKKFISSFAGII